MVKELSRGEARRITRSLQLHRMTKKSRPRKRSSRPKRKPRDSIQRFLRAFVVSAATAFSIASCALNPQLRDEIHLEPILLQLGFPDQAQMAPLAVASGPRVQTRFAQCPQFFPGGSPPVVPSSQVLRELCFSAFAVLHDGKAKAPVFVAQRLNRKMLLQARSVARADKFYPEARLPAAERAELDDYRGSGYSRGHMAPAADMHTPEAMAQSFSLANMVPQDQRHNGGAWSKVEDDTRKYVMRAAGDVFVFTGTVYDSRSMTIGAGRVAVPSHLFKVVYDATTGKAWAHWQANSPQSRVGPPMSYEEFEMRTGLSFLPLR